MIAKIIPRPGHVSRQIRIRFALDPSSRRLFSSSPSRLLPTVSLVYDLHEPSKPTVPDAQTSPIIIMHGLFGSKKNNRSISK